MKFIPNLSIKNDMLKEIGLKHIDQLFSDIPQEIRIKSLDIDNGLSQKDAELQLRKITERNKSYYDILSFLGGGIKQHYVPPAVKSVISRAEFYTSYTPYQSEASQGFLQAMFEYQSIIAELTGMDVANGSLYDGVTALGEAMLMCTRVTGKKTFVIPQNISWEKKSVIQNYATGPGVKIVEIPYDRKTGKIDVEILKQNMDGDVSGAYIENPNFFGVFEDDIDKINHQVKKNDSLFVVGVDPLSLGITRNPGGYGADIVIGEGRALGNPLDFGGSSLGVFACKKEFFRQIPGRIIGMTKDKEGKRSFCMTLQTREQHIRRGRATSNICTNQGLCALAAVVYLALLGGTGFEELGRTNFERGQELAERITSLPAFRKKFSGVHFNEFVIQCEHNPQKMNSQLFQKGIQGGLLIDPMWFPELSDCVLIGVSEMHSNEDIDRFIAALKEVAHV